MAMHDIYDDDYLKILMQKHFIMIQLIIYKIYNVIIYKNSYDIYYNAIIKISTYVTTIQ